MPAALSVYTITAGMHNNMCTRKGTTDNYCSLFGTQQHVNVERLQLCCGCQATADQLAGATASRRSLQDISSSGIWSSLLVNTPCATSLPNQA